ncbi:MAG: hypothetical protein GEV07_11285 [Streptosporangiales bacterium]|nr:hypothetical protein [Streptosporangiales bacterium]
MALHFQQGSRRLLVAKLGLAFVVAVVLITLPFMIGTVSGIGALSQLVAYSVAILGLNLLIGYCGQISLGQSAFVGLGGYTAVILVADHDWPYLATVPVAFLVCAVAGALIGMPALRIRGLYLVTVTLSIAALFPVLVDQFDGLTGGANGKFANEPMTAPPWFFVNPYTLTGPVIDRYYAILAFAALMFLLARNIVRSRIGRAMIAVRDAPLSAASSGVPVAKVKIFTFAMSAAFGGVAGALLVIQLPEVTGARFDLYLSVFLLVGLITGGSKSIVGAIPGAIVFVALRTYIADWASNQTFIEGPQGQQLVGVISGVLLLVCVFLLPGGIADGLKGLLSKVVVVEPRTPSGWEQYRLVTSQDHPSRPPERPRERTRTDVV